MRPSVYNFIFDNGSNYLLYNASSDEIIAMGEELYRLYMENLGDVENIRRRHPGFYQCLLDKEAIVEDSCSESDSVIAKWKASDARSGTFTITVNPTMDCNMSCWYCYERRGPGTKMGKGVARGVLALVERVCASRDAYETILLSFFGGEPLLCFDEIVLPLVREALGICKANGKELRTHFTTNGFLISGEMLESLGTLPASFQITLDGNSTVHNRNKTAASRGTTGIPLEGGSPMTAALVGNAVSFRCAMEGAANASWSREQGATLA